MSSTNVIAHPRSGGGVTFNRAKLKTLVHYVAYRFASDPQRLDPVKLNKVLWFSDVGAYLDRGVPITGAKYIKKPLGPVASILNTLVRELDEEGAIAIRQLKDREKEFLALTTPQLDDMFTAEEMRLIEDAVDMVDKHSSHSISELSHNVVWKLAELDEEIPYFANLAGRLHEIEADDIAWAREELAAMATA